jgi:hypothetical protein
VRSLALLARDQGQALIEFALIIPVLLMLILGLFDLGRAVVEENTLAFAAREATRYAIVHGSNHPVVADRIPACTSCENATITQVVQNNAVGVPGVTAIVNYPDGNNDRGMRVSVDAYAPFIPLPSQYLLNGALTITLRGGSMLVIQN